MPHGSRPVSRRMQEPFSAHRDSCTRRMLDTHGNSCRRCVGARAPRHQPRPTAQGARRRWERGPSVQEADANRVHQPSQHEGQYQILSDRSRCRRRHAFGSLFGGPHHRRLTVKAEYLCGLWTRPAPKTKIASCSQSQHYNDGHHWLNQRSLSAWNRSTQYVLLNWLADSTAWLAAGWFPCAVKDRAAASSAAATSLAI